MHDRRLAPQCRRRRCETKCQVTPRCSPQCWCLIVLNKCRLQGSKFMDKAYRFRHATKVQRSIGFKRGTGATGYKSYLRKILGVVMFSKKCHSSSVNSSISISALPNATMPSLLAAAKLRSSTRPE